MLATSDRSLSDYTRSCRESHTPCHTVGRTVALHRQVLCHGHLREEGAWCAYIFAVPGERHADEAYLWRTEGAKLAEAIALAIFPEFDGVPYAY